MNFGFDAFQRPPSDGPFMDEGIQLGRRGEGQSKPCFLRDVAADAGRGQAARVARPDGEYAEGPMVIYFMTT